MIQFTQGNYKRTLEFMEHAFLVRQQIYGAQSGEIFNARHELGCMCNHIAKVYLPKAKHNRNFIANLLKKAELYFDHHQLKDRAITCNNLACLARLNNDLFGALRCTQQALELEKQLKSQNPKIFFSSADSHMNQCAILSEIGNHESALDHAAAAIGDLHYELGVKISNEYLESSLSEDHSTSPSVNLSLDKNTKRNSRFEILAVAYFNLAAEQEHLKLYDECIISYKKSVEIAIEYLGHQHSTTKKLQRGYYGAERSSDRRQKNATKSKDNH